MNPDVVVFSHDSGEYDGIDNVCVSGVEHMRELIHHFHLNLDKIATQYEYLFFHENMVFYESRLLSGKPMNIDAFSYMTKYLVIRCYIHLTLRIHNNIHFL